MSLCNTCGNHGLAATHTVVAQCAQHRPHRRAATVATSMHITHELSTSVHQQPRDHCVASSLGVCIGGAEKRWTRAPSQCPTLRSWISSEIASRKAFGYSALKLERRSSSRCTPTVQQLLHACYDLQGDVSSRACRGPFAKRDM
jgi:hypothetical protein